MQALQGLPDRRVPIGYGLIRFFIEYARQPDQGIDFPIRLVGEDNPGYRFLTPWNFTTGQILCSLMIAAARRVPGGVLAPRGARRAARSRGAGCACPAAERPQAAQAPREVEGAPGASPGRAAAAIIALKRKAEHVAGKAHAAGKEPLALRGRGPQAGHPGVQGLPQGPSVAPVGFEETGEALRPKTATGSPRLSEDRGQHRILAAKAHDDKPPKGKRVAVLFSGGPAAGGHNVVVGLKRVLGAGNTLFGVKAGPKGLLKGDLFEITDADVDFIINTGGFDFLGTDRTKIKSDEQFAQVRETCIEHKLDAHRRRRRRRLQHQRRRARRIPFRRRPTAPACR